MSNQETGDALFKVDTEDVAERSDKSVHKPGRPKGSKNKRVLVDESIIIEGEKRRGKPEPQTDFSMYDNKPVSLPEGFKRPKGRPRKNELVLVNMSNGETVVADSSVYTNADAIQVEPQPMEAALEVDKIVDVKGASSVTAGAVELNDSTLSILHDFEVAWGNLEREPAEWDCKLRFRTLRAGRKLDLFGLKFISCQVAHIIETVGCVGVSTLLTCVTRAFEASYGAMYGFCCLPSGKALHGQTSEMLHVSKPQNEDEEAHVVLQKQYNVSDSKTQSSQPTIFGVNRIVCLQPLQIPVEHVTPGAPCMLCIEDHCTSHTGHVCVSNEEVKNIKRRVYDALNLLCGTGMITKSANSVYTWSYTDYAGFDKKQKPSVLQLVLKVLETKRLSTTDLGQARLVRDVREESVDLASFPLVGYNHAVQIDNLMEKGDSEVLVLSQYETPLRMLTHEEDHTDSLFVPLIPDPFQQVAASPCLLSKFPVTMQSNAFYQYARHIQLLTHRRFAVYHALCVKIGLEYIRSTQVRLLFPLARHQQRVLELLAKVQNMHSMSPRAGHLDRLSSNQSLPHGTFTASDARNVNLDGLLLTYNEFLVVLLLVHGAASSTDSIETKKCSCPFSWALNLAGKPRKTVSNEESDLLDIIRENPLRRTDTLLPMSMLKQTKSIEMTHETVDAHVRPNVVSLSPEQLLYLASSIVRLQNTINQPYSRTQCNTGDDHLVCCSWCGTVSNGSVLCRVQSTSTASAVCSHCSDGGVVAVKHAYTVEFTKSLLSLGDIAKTGHQQLYQRMYNVAMTVVGAAITSNNNSVDGDNHNPDQINISVTEQDIIETLCLATLIPQHSNASPITSAFGVPELHRIHLAKLPFVVSLFMSMTSKFLPSKKLPRYSTEQNLVFSAPSILEHILNLEKEQVPEICQDTSLLSITRPTLSPLMVAVNSFLSSELLSGMEIPAYTIVAPKSLTLNTVAFASVTDMCLTDGVWQTEIMSRHHKALLLHSKPQPRGRGHAVDRPQHPIWMYFNYSSPSSSSITDTPNPECLSTTPYLSMTVRPMSSPYITKLDELENVLEFILNIQPVPRLPPFVATQHFHATVSVLLRMALCILHSLYNKRSEYSSGTANFNENRFFTQLGNALDNSDISDNITTRSPQLKRMEPFYSHCDEYNACIAFLSQCGSKLDMSRLSDVITHLNTWVCSMHSCNQTYNEVVGWTAAQAMLKESFAGSAFYSLRDMSFLEFNVHNTDQRVLAAQVDVDVSKQSNMGAVGLSLSAKWELLCAYTAPFSDAHNTGGEYESLDPIPALDDSRSTSLHLNLDGPAMDSLEVLEQTKAVIAPFQEALQEDNNEDFDNRPIYDEFEQHYDTQNLDVAPTQSLTAYGASQGLSQTGHIHRSPPLMHYTDSMSLDRSTSIFRNSSMQGWHARSQTYNNALSRLSSFDVPRGGANSFYFPAQEFFESQTEDLK